MPWARHLLFVGLVLAGFSALASQLVPPRPHAPLAQYETADYADMEFRLSVTKIDAAFRQHWETVGVPPADPAPDLQVARRLALGLMGTVPSLEEVRQFEALPEQQRLAWWTDHVLADRRSADYLAERLARAYVGTEDGPFLLFRRRRMAHWLADQVAANRPYDHLAREVIAAGGLWTDHPAANFVTVTAQGDDKQNQPDPIRLAGRTTRAFLGLRLDCAECHDHPFAAWKQSDFEGFAAFFGRTHIGFKGVYDASEGQFEVTDRKTQKVRTVAPAVPSHPELMPATGTDREKLAVWVTHPKNPYFARAAVNRVWAVLAGRPLADPVDNLESESDPHPALQVLADDFAANGFDLRRLIRVIAWTKAYRLDSRADRDIGETDEKAWAVFPLTRLRPEQVSGAVEQAARVRTLDASTHILFRLAKFGGEQEFVKRYGDTGEDEFEGRGGTIPQRLLLMNGELVREKVRANPLNASARIANVSPDDPHAVETAYLCCLSRRPTPAEADHFQTKLTDRERSRADHIADLYWALVNSTEFSWNH